MKKIFILLLAIFVLIGCSTTSYPVLSKKHKKPLPSHKAKSLPCSNWNEQTKITLEPL